MADELVPDPHFLLFTSAGTFTVGQEVADRALAEMKSKSELPFEFVSLHGEECVATFLTGYCRYTHESLRRSEAHAEAKREVLGRRDYQKEHMETAKDLKDLLEDGLKEGEDWRDEE